MVAEALGGDLRVHPGLKQQCGMGVPEVLQGDGRHVGRGDRAVELCAEPVGMDLASTRRRADEIAASWRSTLIAEVLMPLGQHRRGAGVQVDGADAARGLGHRQLRHAVHAGQSLHHGDATGTR